jgi:hypothetical protein
VGSESEDGIDLLKMPIWTDGIGNADYSQINQLSGNKYIPKFSDGRVFAVVGQKSNLFGWEWEKKFYPKGVGVKCQFTSGSKIISGKLQNSSCSFEVPDSLRAGMNFTVTQKWVIGPWHGQATTNGVLVRKDYSSNICTQNTCISGGTSNLSPLCWTKNITKVVLQELVDSQWKNKDEIDTLTDGICKDNVTSTMTQPAYKLKFNQIGTYVYRWSIPASTSYSEYVGTPFAILVNEETSPEPTQTEIDAAQKQAIVLGNVADLVKKSADLLAAQKIAELKFD